MSRRVQRKVYFFELAEKAEFLPLIPRCVELIGTLPFNDQGRYLPTKDDDNVLVLFVESTAFPVKLQFGRIRRSGLPVVEDAGQISPLKLAASAGLLDWAHLILFEDGILAAEFNADAPRTSKLGEYLYFKGRSILPNSPKFKPLFQRTILDELSEFESVYSLDIEAPTLEAASIAEASKSLGQAFSACRKAGKVKKATISLKASRKDPNDLLELARKIFTTSRSREAVTKLKLTGKTPTGRKPLDLLENYLISTEDFMRMDERSRAIDPADAFRILERAYNQKKDKFADAARADDPW